MVTCAHHDTLITVGIASYRHNRLLYVVESAAVEVTNISCRRYPVGAFRRCVDIYAICLLSADAISGLNENVPTQFQMTVMINFTELLS